MKVRNLQKNTANYTSLIKKIHLLANFLTLCITQGGSQPVWST